MSFLLRKLLIMCKYKENRSPHFCDTWPTYEINS